jgi:hypothetical protein
MELELESGVSSRLSKVSGIEATWLTTRLQDAVDHLRSGILFDKGATYGRSHPRGRMGDG